MAYTDWDLLEAIQTEIQSMTDAPSVVQIVPKGKERNRPVDGITDWVNLSVQKSSVMWEVNSSYITTSTIRVNVCTESFKSLSEAQEALITTAASIRANLTRNVLGGLVRKNPKDLGNNYVDADNSALFYAQFDLEYEVQNEENPSVDILIWKEQTDADITVTVEGLDTDEYQFRKANGETGTSGTEYAGASTGTGRIRVLDSADLSKLERIQIDIKGPAYIE